jgi:hypothetical protein
MENGGRDDGGGLSEVYECPQAVIAGDGRGVWQVALDRDVTAIGQQRSRVGDDELVIVDEGTLEGRVACPQDMARELPVIGDDGGGT